MTSQAINSQAINNLILLFGIILGGGGIAGMIVALLTSRAQNAKLLAEAKVNNANAKKTEDDAEGNTIKALAQSAETTAKANTAMVQNLTGRIDGMELKQNRLQETIDRLREEAIARDKYWQGKIGRKMTVIRRNIEKRSALATQTGCPHSCLPLDTELESELNKIV